MDFLIFILSHVADIAGGAFACAILIFASHILGLLAISAKQADGNHASPQIMVLGAAILVVWCGYGIKLRIPLTLLLQFLFGCTLIICVIRRNHISHIFRSREFLHQARKLLFSFLLFYAMAYLFLMPSEPGPFLPLVTLGNNDIFNYLVHLGYLQRLGPSNVANFSFLPSESYDSIPGVYAILGAIALPLKGDALLSMMPTLFGTVALVGCSVVGMSKNVFGLPCGLAHCVGGVLVAGPFFRYIVGQYFLAQILGTLVMFVTIGKVAEYLQRGAAPRWPALMVILAPYQFLMVYFYPSLLVVSVGVQLALVCISVLMISETYGERRQNLFPWGGALTGWGTGIFGSVVIAALLDPGQFQYAAGRVLLLSKVAAGWPLDMISPIAMAGFPVGVEVHGWMSQMMAIALFLVVVSAIGYLYLFRSRDVNASIGKSLFVLAVLANVAYFGYFAIRGVSYQQWKLAAYLPLALSWALWASMGAVLVSVTRLDPRKPVGVSRAWRKRVVLFLSIVLIAGNAVRHIRADPPLQGFSAAFANLKALDALGAWNDVYVQMSSFSSTFFPVFFVTTKTLHLLSPSYYPQEVLNPDAISFAKPLFVEGNRCADGEKRAITIAGLGCLYFHAPGLRAEVQYSFTKPIASLDAHGLSGFEPFGRWSDGPAVRLTFRVDGESLRTPEGFINLNIGPLLHVGIDGQRVVIDWGRDRVARENIRNVGWISLPLDEKDLMKSSGGNISVKFELPDAIAPHDVDSRSGDPRKLAIYFSTMSISTAPLGRVIGGKRQ